MQMMRVELFLIAGEADTDRVLDEMVLSYGGATYSHAEGAWRGNNMEVMVDDVCLVTVFMEDNERNRKELHVRMQQYRRRAHQESVLYVINGNNPIFVTE